MGLFKPAVNQTAYLKFGLQGFQGGGKTFTACELAIGITKLVKGQKVAFFDTEKGSDFMVRKFQGAGVELVVVKSKALVDLSAAIDEAIATGCSALVIDSITHVWREFCSAYLKSKNRTKLIQEDWNQLKEMWADQFTNKFTASPLHIFMCGRAGHEYDEDTDEDTGKRTSHKTGATKMKAESETGFEPDVCLEMMADVQPLPKAERKGKKRKVGAIINRCLVLKDRSDQLNGRTFDKPKFKDFLPIVSSINLGGLHVGPDLARTSQGIFAPGGDRSWMERRTQHGLAIEQVYEALTLAGLDGTAVATKRTRTEALIKAFGTSTEGGISALSLEQLVEGLASLRAAHNLGEPKKAVAQVLNGSALGGELPEFVPPSAVAPAVVERQF